MADSSESTPFLASNDRADDTDALTNAEDEIPTKTLPANAHFKRPIKILIICVSIASLLGVIFLAASYIIVYVGSYQGYNYNVRFVLRELGTCLFISFISSTLMIFLQLPIVVSFITQFVFSILTLVFAGNVFERGWPGNGWYYDYRWKETASILIGIGGGFGFLVGLLYLALVLLQVRGEFRGWADVYLAAVATLAALLVAFFIGRRRLPLPPGPRGWPLLGVIPMLGTLPHQTLFELSKKYGPLMFMHFGNVKTLVVTSPNMAKEILKTHDQTMAGRPVPIAVKYLLYAGRDIGFSSYGQYWRYLRKVCTVGLLTAARLNEFREVRQQEVLASLQYVLEESQRGKLVDMSQCFTAIATNNICKIIMNKSYCTPTYGSTSFVPEILSTDYREMLSSFNTLLGAINLADFVPLLKPFDPQGLTKRVRELHEKIDLFLEEIIDEHRKRPSTPTEENYKEDFVDALLGIGQTSQLQEKLPMDTMKAIILDMLSGSAETSSHTSVWGLCEVLRKPHVLKRAQEELDSVVGRDRLVEESDLPKLTYLQAVLKETLRLHPAVVMMLPHESTQDCQIDGYHIPAKTRVWVNVWGIHRDPAVWERPLEFDPDRFLDSKLDYRGQDYEFLPFGSGRRMCPGMNLGSLMVLYMMAVMLHGVDFSLPDGQKIEDMDMTEALAIVTHKKQPLMVFGKARLPNHAIYPSLKVQN